MKMPRPRRATVRVYRKLQDGPMMPPWVKVVPYLLGFVMFILLSTQLFGGSRVEISDDARARLDADKDSIIADLDEYVPGAPASTPSETSPSNVITLPDAPVPTAPTDPGTPATVPDAATPGVSTVVLQFKNGGSAPIPEAALAAARRATVALFTGDFAGVQLSSNVQPPVLERTWRDPYVGDPMIAGVGDGVVSIVFRVDPDRGGPATLREITTTVEPTSSGTWRWLGV